MLDFLVRISGIADAEYWYADIQPHLTRYNDLRNELGAGSLIHLDVQKVAEEIVSDGVLVDDGDLTLVLAPTDEKRSDIIQNIPVVRVGMKKSDQARAAESMLVVCRAPLPSQPAMVPSP